MLHYPKGYEPTLFDRVYMAAHSKHSRDWFEPSEGLRRTLHAAKRFVLSEPMSGFMADLSTNAFLVKDNKTAMRRIEAMRHSARLPHRVTWIEYHLRTYMEHLEELRRRHPGLAHRFFFATDSRTGKERAYDPAQTPQQEGWLIEEIGENLFQAHTWSYDTKADDLDFQLWLFPWKYLWSVDDTRVPPSPVTFKHKDGPQPFPISLVLTGLQFYRNDKVSAALADHTVADIRSVEADKLSTLLMEWGGVIRRMWSLLATINDIPVQIKDVTPSRGFMGRGQVRKFLPYKTISLTVPQDEYRKLARHVLAIGARRAEHPVRGHYRIDWRRPPAKLCHHTWDAHEVCTTCHGHRMHIREHMRGDPKLGHVDHNYNLRHLSEQVER